MKFNKSLLHFMMAPFVALASVAYIFRFPSAVGEISLFRVALGIYLACSLVKLVRPTGVRKCDELATILAVVALLAAPAVIDILFQITDPAQRRPVYAFVANILFWAAFSLVVDSQYFERYLKWYCWMSVLEATIALYSYWTMTFPLDFLIDTYGSDYVRALDVLNVNDGFVRLTGTFFDPNFYGIYLLSVVAGSLWLYIYKGRSLAYLLLSLVSIALLILTASRTSLLGLGGVVLAYVLYQRGAFRLTLLSCVALAIISGAVALVSPATFDRLLSSESVTDRFAFFERGIDAFVENPIFGGGSESLVDPVSGLSTAHSVYLSILGRNGLFGLISFALAVIIMMAPVITGKCKSVPSRHFAVQALLIIAITFISYDTFYYFEPLYLFFGLTFVGMKLESGGSLRTSNSRGEG